MSLIPGINKVVLCLACCVVLTGCVKDIDLDQAEEIGLSPDINVDLLIYDVDYNDFYDATGTFQPIIKDVVRLEFLDDDYIQDDLTEVEFFFSHSNTFPQEFSHTIRFLSNAGVEQLSIPYTIAAGSSGNPEITEHTEPIEEAQIHLIRNSIQMEVTIEAHSPPTSGELEFASTGLFKFDF